MAIGCLCPMSSDIYWFRSELCFSPPTKPESPMWNQIHKKTGLSVRNPIDGARHNIWLEGIVICELCMLPHICISVAPLGQELIFQVCFCIEVIEIYLRLFHWKPRQRERTKVRKHKRCEYMKINAADIWNIHFLLCDINVKWFGKILSLAHPHPPSCRYTHSSMHTRCSHSTLAFVHTHSLSHTHPPTHTHTHISHTAARPATFLGQGT